MYGQIRHTLPKKERLCGKTRITRLLEEGKHGNIPGFRFCYLVSNEHDYNRIMVSVPKKIFKRAVKRNLLKRRMRESWRLNKETLSATGIDILFTYATKEILDQGEIQSAIIKIIEKINKATANKINGNEQSE
jgi:ribonuclease P protein component